MFGLLSILLLAQVAGLQPGTGIVTGSIRFSDNQPAGAVRVAAISTDDPDGATMFSIAETDASGRYRLANVPEGAYYIVAGRVTSLTYYPGSADPTQAKEILVEAAKIVPGVDFTLPAPASVKASRTDSVTRSEVLTYLEITLETNVDKRLKMLLAFQQAFPKSVNLPEIFTAIMDTYSQHRNAPAVWYSQKLMKEDAAYIALLLETSKTFAQRGNVSSAVEYAQQAVTAAATLKERRPPVPYDGPAWESWVRSIEGNAERQLLTVKPKD
jgi:hypothetical protein